MAVCEVCGNEYHLAFEVITAGRSHPWRGPTLGICVIGHIPK